MTRYLHILAIFYKAAILTNLEYRANMVVYVALSLIGAAWSVAGVAVFFLHTDRIGDWTFPELMIVLGLFISFLGLVDVFVVPNVDDLMEHIRTGTMDFILTKPLNSQFHASLRRLNIWKLADVLLGLGVIGFGLAQLATLPSPGRLLLFAGLYLSATVILYSIIMLLVTSAFWLVQLENVMELLFTFYEAGRFPVSIFPFWVRALLTFVVPIAFVTTVPASVLLGRLDAPFFLYSLLVATILFGLSALYWRFAVRHYSSASS
jgi:ABC-2 type transport system permease protein